MSPAHCLRTAVAVVLTAVLAIGPVVPREPVEVILAETEIPEARLLDVGIELFDPGLAEDDPHAHEDKGVFPEVRKSEARFIPFHLKSVLESSGQWGAVRVIPRGKVGLDVTISGEILTSTGHELTVRVPRTSPAICTPKGFTSSASSFPWCKRARPASAYSYQPITITRTSIAPSKRLPRSVASTKSWEKPRTTSSPNTAPNLSRRRNGIRHSAEPARWLKPCRSWNL